jgi:hypothetical protein
VEQEKTVVQWVREHGTATRGEIISALGSKGSKGSKSPSAVKREIEKEVRAGRLQRDACVKGEKGFGTLFYVDDDQILSAKRQGVYVPLWRVDTLLRQRIVQVLDEAESAGNFGSPEGLLSWDKLEAMMGRSYEPIKDQIFAVADEKGWKAEPGGFWKPGSMHCYRG